MITGDYFQSRFSFDPGRDRIWEVIARFLQKEIGEDSHVLDLGAGYCNFINNIQAKKKHALDILDISNYADEDVIVHIQSCTDMSNLPAFDAVFASNLLEHLSREEIDKTLAETKRILKKKGKLIIIQPNFKCAYKVYFDDYTHQLVFTDVSMRDLLESKGFIVEKLIPRFLPFSMKSWAPKHPIFLKIYLHLPVKPFAGQMLVIARRR